MNVIIISLCTKIGRYMKYSENMFGERKDGGGRKEEEGNERRKGRKPLVSDTRWLPINYKSKNPQSVDNYLFPCLQHIVISGTLLCGKK